MPVPGESQARVDIGHLSRKGNNTRGSFRKARRPVFLLINRYGVWHTTSTLTLRLLNLGIRIEVEPCEVRAVREGKSEMASERKRASRLIIFLPLAGFLSGLLTVGLGNSFGKLGFYGIGSVFGAMMGIALAMTKMLRGAWKATLLIVPFATAYVVSVLAAALVGMLNNFGDSSASRATAPPIATFAGGLIGGYLVLAVVFALTLYPAMEIRTVALKSLYWSPIAGILGVVGWGLGPSLGMTVWHVMHSAGLTAPTETAQNALFSDTSNSFSLFVVWQTGMGLILALALKRYPPNIQE